jgi:hypothetical protein
MYHLLQNKKKALHFAHAVYLWVSYTWFISRPCHNGKIGEYDFEGSCHGKITVTTQKMRGGGG